MIDVKSPSLTVDAAVVEDGRIVFIKRVNFPFKDYWALPGGFVDVGETVEAACVREAREETCLEVEIKKLVGVYSDPQRDPRGHTVGVVFWCEKKGGELKARDDAAKAKWFDLDDIPELAFDHEKIVADVKAIL